MSKKKYTFEDWKTGKIYRDHKDKNIKDFPYDEVRDSGWLPKILYEKGFMEVDEFRRINKAQKETFFRAAEMSAKTRVNTIKNRMSKAPEPDKLLDNRIESLKSFVDESSKYLQGLLYAGDWDRSGVNYSKHMQVNDPRIQELEGKMEMNFTSFNVVTNELGHPELRPPHPSQDKPNNPLYDLTFRYKALQKLKELKEEREAANDIVVSSKNSDYPDPKIIAQKFKDDSNTKSKDDTYSADEIAHVMKYARDFPRESNYAELIRKFEADDNCPKNIKGIKYDTPQNWIKFYDDHAQIERK